MSEKQSGITGTESKFPFRVRFANGAQASFEECSIDTGDGQPTEYRHGNSPVFYPIKMPGLGRIGNVTMRKGIFVNDEGFHSLSRQIEAGSKEGHEIAIDMIDEKGRVKVTWTLNNAWPTKVVVSEVIPEEREAVVERVEILFEKMVVSDPAAAQTS